MRKVKLCDVTLAEDTDEASVSLTFRKKLDIASLLDRMQIPVIELGEIPPTTEGKLLIKAVASAVKQSTVSVCVGFDSKNVDYIWDALKTAAHPRLQVTASLSTSRMEYVYHKKAADMLPLIADTVARCRSLSDQVEFCADDATRADFGFVKGVLEAAIQAGAGIITVSDTSGNMLPTEFARFIADIREKVTGIDGVSLGVRCNNGFGLADAAAVEAIRSGASEIKVSAGFSNTVSLSGMVGILNAKADFLEVRSDIGSENFSHNEKLVKKLCNLTGDAKTPFENGVRDSGSETVFTEKDTEETVIREIEGLGYDLSEQDKATVFAAFSQIVSKKKQIDLHELEVIVASESMQVPQAYKLNSFTVTTGNTVDTVAHIKLERDGKPLDGVSLGNGSVDASFLAIEKILGCHYELDDFQIQAITEGKEAMGQTVVKLRSHGKVYSGRGVSTDIVTSAVNAYINALNKIVYEEERT